MRNQVSGKMMRGGIYGIRKADIILIAVCFLAAALLGAFLVVRRQMGSEMRIMYEGIELKRVTLHSASKDSREETGNQYFLITYRDDAVSVENFANRSEPKLAEGTSYNLVSVTDGMVVVEDADCKDQICVRHKAISSRGESIICLPHRLVVEIVGGENTVVNIQDRNSGEMLDEPLDGVVR